MNKLNNYTSPLPPKEQKNVYRWYTISVHSFIVLIITLVFITGYQYSKIRKIQSTYRTLHQSIQELQHETKDIEQLTKEHETLQNRITKIHNIRNKPFNHTINLKEIKQQIPSDVCLTEFTCSKNKTLTFQGYTHKAESIFSFIQSIEHLPYFERLQLTSLTPAQSQSNNAQWFQFTVKGTLKKVVMHDI